MLSQHTLGLAESAHAGFLYTGSCMLSQHMLYLAESAHAGFLYAGSCLSLHVLGIAELACADSSTP